MSLTAVEAEQIRGQRKMETTITKQENGTRVYRNHAILLRSDVDSNWQNQRHQKWSIDRADQNSRVADYSHGYVTLADAKKAIDEMLDGIA